MGTAVAWPLWCQFTPRAESPWITRKAEARFDPADFPDQILLRAGKGSKGEHKLVSVIALHEPPF